MTAEGMQAEGMQALSVRCNQHFVTSYASLKWCHYKNLQNIQLVNLPKSEPHQLC